MRWVGYKPNTCPLANGANRTHVGGRGWAWSQRVVCWLGLALLLFSTQAAADDHLIIRARPGTIHELSYRHGLMIKDEVREGGLYLVESVYRTPLGEIKKQLEADPDVLRVELNGTALLPEISSDSLLNQSTVSVLNGLLDPSTTSFYGAVVKASYVDQPATRLIQLQDGLAIAAGQGVTVAIIDTGVDPEHPALKSWLLPGFNFINGTSNVSEFQDLDQSTVSVLNQSTVSVLNQSTVAVLNQSTVAVLNQSTVSVLNSLDLPAAFGHGTMVAGLVHLTAPNAMVMPLKVFRADGTGSLFDIVRAIYYAVNNGARVINMSFSFPERSKELRRAINYAASRGVLCVASVGNGGQEVVVYPAGWNRVAGIAATTNEDIRAQFSNYDEDMILLGAPGTGVITTYPGATYAAVWGTSFSTALGAGAAAAALQLIPSASIYQLLDVLRLFSQDVADETVEKRLALHLLLFNLQLGNLVDGKDGKDGKDGEDDEDDD